MRTPNEVTPGAVPAYLSGGVAVLKVEESVWSAMLDGWRAQQFARNLSPTTVEQRQSVVRRFCRFADSYPWSWSVAIVDEFFLELLAIRGASQSTILGYQGPFGCSSHT